MKNIRMLSILVGLFCLGLSASAVVPDPSDTAAIEPASPESTGEVIPEELSELGSSAEFLASGCSASFDCGDGTTASCTGNYSCVAYPLAVPSFVKCDGTKYYCPNMCFVDVQCSPTNVIFCSSNVGNCQEGPDWVQCDGGEVIECGARGGPDGP